jgi:hypothetical protein
MRGQLGQGGGSMNIVLVASDSNDGLSEKSMAAVAAIEEHRRQQEFSDLAMSSCWATTANKLGCYSGTAAWASRTSA